MRTAPAAMTRALMLASLVASAIGIVTTRAQAQDSAAPRWKRSHCMAGITYGAPLEFAASYGGGLLRESDGRDVCAMGIAKLGVGGVQAGIGLGATIGALGGGALLSANVLRTFGSPLHATPRRTYVGASIHLWPLLAFGGEFGVYTRIGADPAGTSQSRRLLAWSAGVGF